MSGFAALVVFLLLGAVGAERQVHGEMWWRNAQVQRSLHLTPPQVQRLEQIFYEDFDLRAARRRMLRQLETQFAEALQAGDVTGIEESGLVDQMEELRARINVRRSLMLLAMYRTLSPGQRKTLTQMYPPGRFARP